MSSENDPFVTAERFEALDELPFAILYYARAGANKRVELLQERLGIPKESGNEPLLTIDLSLSLLLLFSILLALSGSLWIYLKKTLWMRLTFVALLSLFLLLSHIILLYYLSPIRGVVVQGTTLYTAPSRGAERVSETVLLPGSTLRALEVEQQGFWLKVVTPSGEVGYLPASSVRLL